MQVITLSPLDLAIAALLIVALAGLSLRLHLGVERQLLTSAARSTIQLLLIGLALTLRETDPLLLTKADPPSVSQ